MRWNEINEDVRVGSRGEFLTKLFRHIQTHIDSDMTRQEFNASYRELMSHLVFPLTIYRGLSFGDDIWFDAHDSDWDEQEPDQRAAVRDHIAKIDFAKIGTSWTWDRRCAVEGGVLAHAFSGAHVIVSAEVSMRQVDLPITIFQNLTVFQEEKEVRLKPSTPLRITGIYPDTGITLPIRANTGPESWDTRNSTLADLDR